MENYENLFWKLKVLLLTHVDIVSVAEATNQGTLEHIWSLLFPVNNLLNAELLPSYHGKK